MAGGYRFAPQGIEAIAARFREIDQRMDKMQAAITSNHGLRVDANRNLIVDDNAVVSSNFDGDIDAGTAGTVGWALGGPDDNAVFNQIILRNGIIGLDALAHPVTAAVFQEITSPTFTTTPTAYASATVTVPTGFTRALINATASAVLMNPGATRLLSCQIETTAEFGATGAGAQQTVTASGSGQAVDSVSQDATVVGGSTFTVAASVTVDGSVPSFSGSAVITGSVTFLR